MNTDDRRNGNGRPDWHIRPIPDQSAAPSSTGGGSRSPVSNGDVAQRGIAFSELTHPTGGHISV